MTHLTGQRKFASNAPRIAMRPPDEIGAPRGDLVAADAVKPSEMTRKNDASLSLIKAHYDAPSFFASNCFIRSNSAAGSITPLGSSAGPSRNGTSPRTVFPRESFSASKFF